MVWHVWPSSHGLRCATGNLCHVEQQPGWAWNAWDNSPIAYMPRMCICLPLKEVTLQLPHVTHFRFKEVMSGCIQKVLATPWLRWTLVEVCSESGTVHCNAIFKHNYQQNKLYHEGKPDHKISETEIQTSGSWALGDALGRSGQLSMAYCLPCLALKGCSGLRLARFT